LKKKSFFRLWSKWISSCISGCPNGGIRYGGRFCYYTAAANATIARENCKNIGMMLPIFYNRQQLLDFATFAVPMSYYGWVRIFLFYS
jgi:hypothetical protein